VTNLLAMTNSYTLYYYSARKKEQKRIAEMKEKRSVRREIMHRTKLLQMETVNYETSR